ncbi:MAG TPA: cation:proton antiporter [Candidatus Thermoplasmatota archaeon]|nr:cation:proton antiporter [Candidatus Thermoplasmatota archaeon]
MTVSPVELPLVYQVVLAVLSLAFLLTFVRLLRGPSIADRVVALELMSAIAAGFSALYALATHQAVFMDAALVLALISFMATVAFARYLEKRNLKGGKKEG